jgi:hypothetical protein
MGFSHLGLPGLGTLLGVVYSSESEQPVHDHLSKRQPDNNKKKI